MLLPGGVIPVRVLGTTLAGTNFSISIGFG
jgi:hypothetical protein